ncbi:glycosyltransferase family 4 protein [Kitasatospora sp. NPDC093806]|uniref:glycosyltransferase family 4 protein n=1 Tax=Kitasatospora sp. NPDC093806 TaxID=3155075 RepID=UPI00343FB657
MPEATPVRTAGTRPRILHLITDPRRRGAQSLARDLHRELRRRGQASALRALAPHPDAHPDAPFTRATAVLGPGRLHPRTLTALRTAARTADLVLAHGSATLSACALALAGTRTPFVYVSVGDPRHWPAGPVRRLRTGALLHRAAAVTALAEGARELLVDRFRLPAATVHTIPNARAADRYPPADGEADKRAARHALGLPTDSLLVAWLGAITPEKRLDLALDALDRLPDVRLAVAGDGPQRTALERHPAAARAHFLGTLADPAPLYRAADAVLLSSDDEGVPGVLIEAALAGLPAVATDVGWVGSVVRDGTTGALVAPGDPLALAEALAKVLAGDRAGLGAAARAHALAHCELDVVADAWQRLFAEVCGVPAAGSSGAGRSRAASNVDVPDPNVPGPTVPGPNGAGGRG